MTTQELILLNLDSITAAIDAKAQALTHITLLEQVDSTDAYLQQHPGNQAFEFCLMIFYGNLKN